MVEVVFPWRCGLVVMGDAVASIENLELSTQDFGLCDDLQTVRKRDCTTLSQTLFVSGHASEK